MASDFPTASTTARRPAHRREDSPARERDSAGQPSQPPRWVLFAGIGLIALQLLALDVVIERHARQAQARAANYVTVTLQPPAQEATAPALPPPVLAAGL